MDKHTSLNLVADSISRQGLYISEFTQKRCDEIIGALRGDSRVIPEVIMSDQFKAIVIDVVQKFVIETSEAKRSLYKNLLLNVARGVESEFDEKTRLIRALESTSVEEIQLLSLWMEGGLLNTSPVAKKLSSIDLPTIQGMVRSSSSRNMVDGLKMELEGPRGKVADKYNPMLLALGSRNLLYVLSDQNFGSGAEVKVRGLTEFGSKFCKFISS
ncbi:hypothetical protein KBD61_04470 [Patescibacteria group bacterium]|nr:hypothetical protein [Patescibacteria group bacterium]MBP9710249.1 hypothetical protein [Patescibacteria group bacterium]